MKVIISGSTGFTGTRLIDFFRDRRWNFTPLSRKSFEMEDNEFLSRYIEGSDVVINLAGAPVIKRWTAAYKEEIYWSRVSTARKLSQAIIKAKQGPSVFISASAVGIYDSVHEQTEQVNYLSDDFLGKVCRDWETEVLAAKDSTRAIILRTGIVLANNGGAMKTLESPFKAGLGGTIGKGEQSMSWIHIRDLMEIYKFVVEHQEISGIINAVAPVPTTNEHFTKTFAKVLNKPATLRIPEFALKLKFGEGAQVLIKGQRVLPERLLMNGFNFAFPTIEKALLNLSKLGF